MKRIAVIITLILGFVVPVPANFPLVRNFTRKDYGWGTQNWQVTEDQLGRMWFANRNGLLMFDGMQWQRFYLDNYATIRGLCVDTSRNRIWVAASETLGYFEPSGSNGALHYVSLASRLLQTKLVDNIGEVWDVDLHGNDVWFRADNYIARYDGQRMHVIATPAKTTSSAFMGEKYILACEKRGLWSAYGDKLKQISVPENLSGADFCAMAPLNSGAMVVLTAFDGAYLLQGNSLEPMLTAYWDFLIANQGFSMAVRENLVAFGTVRNGAMIVDLDHPEQASYVNQLTGMQNNTVLGAFFDKTGNLWLGLDNGVDYVMFNAPFRTLLGHPNTFGAGYASFRMGGELLLGTNQGLYTIDYPAKSDRGWLPPTPRSVLSRQIWSIDTIGHDVFVAADRGLFLMTSPSTPVRIEGIESCVAVNPLREHPDKALVATYDGYYLISKDAGGWRSEGKIGGFSQASGRYLEDYEGNLWLSHWLHGVYRLRLSPDLKRFRQVRLYNAKGGLPTDANNTATLIDNEIYFVSDGQGFFTYDPTRDQMRRNDAMNGKLPQPNFSHTEQTDSRTVWSVSNSSFWVSRMDFSGNFEIDSITFNPLKENVIPGSVRFDRIDSDHLIFPNLDGFYELDIEPRKQPASPELFISAVYAQNDSLVYFPDFRGERRELTVPYGLNTLKFEAAVPEYNADRAVTFSFMLEGYDNDDSEERVYTPAWSKEYTHLSEGRYTLVVRARDSYTGRELETRFEFRISAPWYRSWIAWLVYMCLFIIAILIALRLIRRYADKAAHRMEEQKSAELEKLRRQTEEDALRRDHEISKLKNEQLEKDVKSKSEELTTTTMNVVRKNEILLDISERLSKLQKHLEEENASATRVKDVKRLLALIRENISHDDDLKRFTANFDVVYENFTKRLIAEHPGLTVTDVRICCYLRMGLSSKDIAPLMNISPRSVEMSRYRLRKKLNLEREVNIQEYLQRFS